MKKLFLNFAIMLLSATMLTATFSSCDPEEPVTPPIDSTTVTSNEVVIKSNITANRQFVNDSIYILEGEILVQSGSTLTIEAGTVIKGDKSTKGTLVVMRGAKIEAIGTASAPIVFTSRLDAGLRAPGDWGGVVIVGNATCNQSDPSVEGLTNDVSYGGGTDDADNSGTLQYVRIEFAGIALQPDKEINGLTMCAVGSGTTVDHIQVSYSGDDSFEFFGGTVNAKNVIAYLGVDDDFDTDYGYRGKLQFGLGVRHPRVADVSGSNGFESDNDGSGSDATPKTAAVFSNFTMVGPYKTTSDKNISSNYAAGAHIRRNSSISLFNTVLTGWNTAGILLDATKTYANAEAGTLCLQNCAVVGIKAATDLKGAGITDSMALEFYSRTAFNNVIIDDNATAKIENSFYNASATGTDAIPSSFLPGTGSPLLGAGSFTNAKIQNSFFDQTANYVGAFGTTDWTQEAWVNFDPQNTEY